MEVAYLRGSISSPAFGLFVRLSATDTLDALGETSNSWVRLPHLIVVFDSADPSNQPVIAGVMEHTHDVIAPWRCESIM